MSIPNKLLALVFCILTFQAEAQVTELQRCPAIADAVARLACYDAAMPPVSADGRSTASQTAPARVATAAASLPVVKGTRADQEAAFGLQREQRTGELQTIESTTVSDFYGWRPNERIRLQNGQVWRVTDGSSATLGRPANKVTVRKGLFGAFFLQFQGLNQSPRVERIE